MKILNGAELASFVKVRQLKQVRNLRQSKKIIPKLSVVYVDSGNKVIDTYINLKKAYANDILVEFSVYKENADTIIERLNILSCDDSIHGIIVQLPLPGDLDTDQILSHINPNKDVDGLSGGNFTPATPMAINWLLSGYGIDLSGKNVAIVGRGKLVGAPLTRLWKESGYNVDVFEKGDGYDLYIEIPKYDVIVTATGATGLIKSSMLKSGAVVIDAGTASEKGIIKGDLSDDVRERKDLIITPDKGGVGPLTVAALFDNTILAAYRQAKLNGM